MADRDQGPVALSSDGRADRREVLALGQWGERTGGSAVFPIGGINFPVTSESYGLESLAILLVT